MQSSVRREQERGGVSEVVLALQVPIWAGRFYLRHLALVVGISTLPAVQRAVSQLWGEQIPGSLGLAGEIVTGIARAILLVVVFRLAILSEERLRGLDARTAVDRVRRFARSHWGSLLVQLGLIALMVLVFDRIPDAVIAPRVPEESQDLYWAVLLAAKNPTIIAFTLIWEVGILRQMLLYESRDPAGDPTLATVTGEAER